MMVKFLSVCALLLAWASPAAAQPAVEVSGGYMLLHLGGEARSGWYGDATLNVNRWWGVAGEVGGVYKTFTLPRQERLPDGTLITRSFSATVDHSIHHFLFGARFRLPRIVVIEPFVQALSGAAYLSSDAQVEGLTGFFAEALEDELSTSATRFTVQPGGGATIRFSRRVGARLAVDYRRIFLDQGRGDNEFRLATGITWAVPGR